MARSRTTFLPISVMRRVGADLLLMDCKANSRTFCATRRERFIHEACRAAPFRMATGRPISTSGMSSMLRQLARQPILGSTSTASVMGVVVMVVPRTAVVAISRREHTTASTRSERTTSVPPPHTDGLLLSAMSALPMSMFSKLQVSNRLCNRASLLIRSAL